MRKWFVGTFIGAILAAAVVAPWVAQAATSGSVGSSASTSSGSPGQGLEISPPVIELSANPGQTVTTKISLRDVTHGELIAKGQTDDFGAGTNEDGQPQLLLNETGATRYSLKYWIEPVPDMDLQPQQLVVTTVIINVPANAEPGGHYGVVRFTALPPNLQGTGVALSASVGTLILLRVNGPVTDKLSLVEFSNGHQTKDGSWINQWFFETGPVGFLVRLRNEGTVHEQPSGRITVKNAWGHQIATMTVNANGGNVLPDSIRRFTEQLSNKKLFGYYKATVALTYAGSKHLSGTLSFWVIPWKLLLAVLVLLIVLFFAFRWGLRRYNEHIISKASGKR
jgi:hypothetical protein